MPRGRSLLALCGLITWVVCAGCATRSAPDDLKLDPRLEELAVIPERMDYAFEAVGDKGWTLSAWAVERYRFLGMSGDVATFEYTTEMAMSDGRTLSELGRIYLGPEGHGFLGSARSEEVYKDYDPPRPILPARPEPGFTWRWDGRYGDEMRASECAIRETPVCDTGVMSLCRTTSEDRTRTSALHYCPGWGLSAMEAETIRHDGAPGWIDYTKWIEVDGERAPTAPLRDRSPFGEPGLPL